MMARQQTGCARLSASSASKTRGRKSAQWLIKNNNKKDGHALAVLFVVVLVALSSRASEWGHLAGLGNGGFVHAASVEPLGGELNAGEQVNFWLEAEFAAGFLHAVLVVAAEHHRAKLRDDG